MGGCEICSGWSWVRSFFASIEQDLVGLGTTLPDTEYVDSRAVVHWASVLARATTYAEGGIQIWLLDFPCVAVTIDDLGGAHVDGFWRSGTPLFADDAVGSHGPRQTAAAIVESRANPDRLRVAVYAHDPAFGLGGDLPDGASWANL